MTKKHYYICTIVIHTRVNGCENRFAITAPTFVTTTKLCNRSKVIKTYVRKNIFPEYIIEGAYDFGIYDFREIPESVALKLDKVFKQGFVEI